MSAQEQTYAHSCAYPATHISMGEDSRTLRADRLRERMKERGVDQPTLAAAIGVSQGTISLILTGKTQNSRHLPAIADYLNVSYSWLAGNSDRKESVIDSLARVIPTNLGSSVSDKRQPWRTAEPERDPDLVDLPEIDLRYGLGGTYLDSPIVESKRRFSRSWLRQLTHASPEHLFWALGDGDSMEPTIRSGELMLIDRSQLTPRAGDGIWAFAWGDVGMVKRLRPLPNGNVEIHSDNPLVPPAMASDGDIHMVGRVVAVVRRV